MRITPVTDHTFSDAIVLLQQNKLPVEDINRNTPLFTLHDDQHLLGIVGIEISGDAALLRSLCINEDHRNSGGGRLLVTFIENYAQEKGIKEMYLLTTTAASFFSKRGYKVTDRNMVPAGILQMSEFSFVCPHSATVMKKELSLFN